MIKMYIDLRVKYPLFLLDLNETLNFLNRFSKNTDVSNFMRTRSVGAELFMRTTDRHDEVNSRFSQFFGRS
jgi:hypothetical protein